MTKAEVVAFNAGAKRNGRPFYLGKGKGPRALVQIQILSA